MQKITEQSAAGQVVSFAGILTAIAIPFFLAAIWIADVAADTKYATDEDVLAVQTQVANDVRTIKIAVDANTATVSATAKSVDGLTLVVLDLQIGELEAEIVQLEADKRADAAAWNERDETSLRSRQRALQSLGTQRTALFARVIAPPP